MQTALRENLIKQIRSAIEHLRMAPKAGGAVDISFKLHNPLDLVKFAHGLLQLGQRVEGAKARGLVALGLVEFRSIRFVRASVRVSYSINLVDNG
jgi:hypothetical protein